MGDLREMMQARRAEHTLAALRRQAAQRETRTVDTVVRLPLADITVDERVQVRAEGLDANTVAAYATVFGEGGEFPPVVVFRDEDSGELYLADGFHRVAAARQAGLTEIAAEVRPGGLAGAVEYAEEANLMHGLNLTTRDKRAIFERRLARGHEWATWSNRALAAALGVTEGTIRNWRAELEKMTAQNYAVALEKMTAQNYAVAPQKRVGADGREYDVRNIQAASRQRAQSKPTPRYVDDPEFDQTGGEWDDAAPAPAPRPSPRPLLPTADRIQQAVVDALQDSGVGLTLAQLHNRVEKRLASRVHEPTLSAIVTKLVSQGALRHEPVTGTYDLARASAERGQGEEQVRRLAEQLEAAICDLLRGGPLTMTEMLWGLREARLDAESALGTAALRVALNQLLKTGQVVRDGPRYELVVEERAAVVLEWALQDVLGKMDALAGALDEMLALSVDDERLQHPAVRQALGRLWEAFPPLRERLTQSEERVETLLRVMGGLA